MNLKEEDRPGPKLAKPKQPMCYMITCVFLLNCLHTHFQYTVALRALALLAYKLYGISTSIFENEIVYCQQQLITNRSEIRWCMDKEGLHYNYTTNKERKDEQKTT
jgi:hypothetical protein